MTYSQFSRIHSQNSQIFILLSFFAYLLTLRLDFLSFYFAMNAFIQPGLGCWNLILTGFYPYGFGILHISRYCCLSTYYYNRQLASHLYFPLLHPFASFQHCHHCSQIIMNSLKFVSFKKACALCSENIDGIPTREFSTTNANETKLKMHQYSGLCVGFPM